MAGVPGIVGVMGLTIVGPGGVAAAATAGAGGAIAAVVVVGRFWAGGRSYFWSWRRYASAVGTAPQHTSKVLVLARTSWTRDGAGGFSVVLKKSKQFSVRHNSQSTKTYIVSDHISIVKSCSFHEANLQIYYVCGAQWGIAKSKYIIFKNK